MKVKCLILRIEDKKNGVAIVANYGLEGFKKETKLKEILDMVNKLNKESNSKVTSRFGFVEESLVSKKYYEFKGVVLNA